MSPLVPCPSCARHVRSSESACPFCSAQLPSRLASRAVPSTSRRLDRLAAFTFATTVAVVGCSGTTETPTVEEDIGAVQPMYGKPPDYDAGPKDAGKRDSGARDSGRDARPDGAVDAGPADAGPCEVRDDGGVMALYGLPPIDPCPDTPRDGGGVMPLYGAPADEP